MIEIKRWDNGSVIHCGEFSSIKECLEDGVRQGVDFSYAKLNHAELTGAQLNYVKLNYAELNYAKLNYAKLNYAELYRVELNDAQLNYAELNYVKLNRAELIDAKLYRVELNDAQLNYAELSYAELSHAKLDYAELVGTKFSGKHCCISCGEKYWLFIHEQVVVAGCHSHSPDAWRNMTKEEVAEMDGEYFLKYYPRLLDLMDFFLGEGDRPEWVC